MATNYIENYPENINWQALKALDFSCLYHANKFALTLDDGNVLLVNTIVRIVPGKRLLVFGIWKNKAVAAKIFFDKRHMERELKGLDIFKKNKIPSPTIWFQGKSADGNAYVLVMHRYLNARNLLEMWQEKANIAEVHHAICASLVELATQHVLSIRQHDLHLNNFLITKHNHIVSLDAADVSILPRKLTKNESMEHIALFISQLGALEKEQQIGFFLFYAKTRGWILTPNDVPEFLLMIKKHHEQRWRAFQEKIMRASSQFGVIRKINLRGMYDRHYANEKLLQYLHQPELFFQDSSLEILKAGRSSTVGKINLGHRTIVIKRYNIKNIWHHLRRAFRTTRAQCCWRFAHKLNLFYVATAKPIAYIEKSTLGCKSTSYFISEYIAGTPAQDYFANAQVKEPPEEVNAIIGRVVNLLKQLCSLEVSHGDLKITNILLDEGKQPIMIDFDGAKEHESLHGLHKAWRKEIQRFLLNFADMPEIQARFLQELK